jgi:hypothetical protein
VGWKIAKENKKIINKLSSIFRDSNIGKFSLVLSALSLMTSLGFSSLSEAKKNDSTSKRKSVLKPVASVPSQRLKKDVSFDDYAVKGKYLVPLSSVTVVEEDKNIDDLIGVRRNFDDRVEATKEMK